MLNDKALDVPMFLARRARTWFDHLPACETLYSAAARFHHSTGFARPESSGGLLFGHPRAARAATVPVGLATLEALTAGRVRADEQILRRRTALGPYLPLLPASRRQAVVCGCSNGDAAKAKSRAGLSWNRVATEHALRLCPDCLKSQIARHGFAYWCAWHQWPGIWACRRHRIPLLFVALQSGKRVDWLVPEECLQAGKAVRPDNPGDIDFLCAVWDALAWFTERASIDVKLLSVAVRDRLYRERLLRNELSVSDKEFLDLEERLRQRLGGSNVPHYERLVSRSWIRSLLVDSRNVHPLPWATLLAFTGNTSMARLTSDYAEAAERFAQYDMFDARRAHHRERAPHHVYLALTGPGTLEELAERAHMSRGELERWLRRDPELGAHRRKTRAEVKQGAACFTIDGYCREHPGAMRSSVIKDCLWAVRWLESNDPSTLEQHLPPIVSMFDPQLRLQFEEERDCRKS